jgi:5-methylcytosine-specific restriction protein B
MKPKFWKLSQGDKNFKDIIESINDGLVYVHKNTRSKGISVQSQADDFVNASIGDYFYLTHGNNGIYCIGQFSGPANIFSKYREGWMVRKFDFIFASLTNRKYSGVQKWWAPNDNSTFTCVPSNEMSLFEKEILKPFFGISLDQFGLS